MNRIFKGPPLKSIAGQALTFLLPGQQPPIGRDAIRRKPNF
jgi:hypothetical protein